MTWKYVPPKGEQLREARIAVGEIVIDAARDPTPGIPPAPVLIERDGIACDRPGAVFGLYNNPLKPGRVPWQGDRPDAPHEFHLAVDGFQPIAETGPWGPDTWDLRFVSLPIGRQGIAGIVPFPLLDDELGPGKSLKVETVVPVQMGKDNQVNLRRMNPELSQGVPQFLGL
jgi:hypothetical protein